MIENDPVSNPSHYTNAPFECFDLTREYPFAGGNAIKYVFRHRAKNGVEDLKKAAWYLDHATCDELRPRADRHDMTDLKGMWELAHGYDSGLTRARRAVTRRISLMESPLTDDELLLLDGWSPTPTALWRLKARGSID